MDTTSKTLSSAKEHICVCICTYKRPELLRRLLDSLEKQESDNSFTYSIVVVDNDRLRSAEAVVSSFVATSFLHVVYQVEPQQNIALARNKAIQSAIGDLIALIDDDEFPRQDWLLNLFRASKIYGVSGVLGPVKRHFDEIPPGWVSKGKFYERPTGSTGSPVNWRMGRTGNVLLNRLVFAGEEQPFRPEFRAGEDQDFFRRMIAKGHKFVWCNEAIAYEAVPAHRWKRSFMMKQALLRGATARLQPTLGLKDVSKSLIAVPLYAIALPFALVLGQHRFMDLVIRECDHLGKLLALVGINPIKAPYVVE